MDKASWIDNIKVRLGYPILNLAITDDMIAKQIEYAIKKVVPYLNSFEVFMVNSKVTEIKDKVVYTIVRVGTSSSSSSTTNYDTKEVAMWQGLYMRGGVSRYATNAALYTYAMNELQNSVGTLDYRWISNVLYIDNGTPPFYVEAITENSIKNMGDVYLNWCFEYSLALTQLIEGEIRSKVKVEGSPIELNGEAIKSEGQQKISELEEKLGNQLAMYYSTR